MEPFTGKKDVFTVHLTTAGDPWHVDYTFADVKEDDNDEDDDKFVRVETCTPVRGTVAVLKPPVVPGQDPIEDNRSFIQKYWMFIVPMLLVFMLGGGN
ncbi:uncharacterized protein V1516DRAFT_628725 [Lipomyces oligophaga]|uniref:uncharacterized protein n=1 Tax=Lipomyces oligophaga TaxID=45792 RepID=UPI0034CE72E5